VTAGGDGVFTKRDLELLEVALESAILALDDTPAMIELRGEYDHALDLVQGMLEEHR
jgi:hypothetical protein